jgi:hypothetical protein
MTSQGFNTRRRRKRGYDAAGDSTGESTISRTDPESLFPGCLECGLAARGRGQERQKHNNPNHVIDLSSIHSALISKRPRRWRKTKKTEEDLTRTQTCSWPCKLNAVDFEEASHTKTLCSRLHDRGGTQGGILMNHVLFSCCFSLTCRPEDEVSLPVG